MVGLGWTLGFECVTKPRIFEESVERLVTRPCVRGVHAFWLPAWEGGGGGHTLGIDLGPPFSRGLFNIDLYTPTVVEG